MSRVIERRGTDGQIDLSRADDPLGLHPWAWWTWALGAAACATAANNPLFVLLLVVAIIFVVLQRRSNATWTRSLNVYFYLVGFIIVMRLFFQILVGGLRDGTVLFSLPQIHLPAWAAGIQLGGDVTLEAIIFSVVDSCRIGAMILAIGAANTLANPKRALKSVPMAFAQLATAFVIALSAIPQMIESIHRVRRARRLRGKRSRGISGMLSLIVPVLVDAVERSMSLAASMESRGYGRTRSGKTVDIFTSVILIVAMIATIFGTFALLAIPSALLFSLCVFALGIALLAYAIARCSAQIAMTRYRPDPWRKVETIVCIIGIGCAAYTFWLASHDPFMTMVTYPMTWPQLSVSMVLVAIFLASPGIFTPSSDKAWS